MSYETELQNIIDMWGITESTDVRKDQAVLCAVAEFVIEHHWETLRDEMYDNSDDLKGLLQVHLKSSCSKEIKDQCFGEIYTRHLTGLISDIFHGAVGNSDVNYAGEVVETMFGNPTYDLVAADRRSGK